MIDKFTRKSRILIDRESFEISFGGEKEKFQEVKIYTSLVNI